MDRLGLAVLCGYVQGRAGGADGVQVSASSSQQGDRGRLVGLCGAVEGALPARVGSILVGARGQELLQR